MNVDKVNPKDYLMWSVRLKTPISKAIQMEVDFDVTILGEMILGKATDYLIIREDGSKFLVTEEDFKQYYEYVEEQ